MHLTDKAIRAARPGKELFDNSVAGFGLRVTPKGTRSWMLRYRFAGKQKRISLGTYPAYSLSEARTLARETRLKLERGAGYIKSRRSEPRVNEALALFIEKYAKPRNRTWRETASRFDQYVRPPLGGMPPFCNQESRRAIHPRPDNRCEETDCGKQASRKPAQIFSLVSIATVNGF